MNNLVQPKISPIFFLSEKVNFTLQFFYSSKKQNKKKKNRKKKQKKTQNDLENKTKQIETKKNALTKTRRCNKNRIIGIWHTNEKANLV